jgi:hypothetical protein
MAAQIISGGILFTLQMIHPEQRPASEIFHGSIKVDDETRPRGQRDPIRTQFGGPQCPHSGNAVMCRERRSAALARGAIESYPLWYGE